VKKKRKSVSLAKAETNEVQLQPPASPKKEESEKKRKSGSLAKAETNEGLLQPPASPKKDEN